MGRLKRLGRLGGAPTLICLVCSAALEALGIAWTESPLIQHAKSERVGCWLSEPLDTLIGDVLAV